MRTMVQRGKPKPQGYISSGIQVHRSRAQPTAAPRCTERHRAVRCPGSCPALAKLSPYERFGASRLKNRPFLAKSAPSERILPSCPAPSSHRGRFLFAQEGGGSSPHWYETPVRDPVGGRSRPSAPVRPAGSTLPASPEPFTRGKFRQNRLVFQTGSRNPLTRRENRQPRRKTQPARRGSRRSAGKQTRNVYTVQSF